MPAFSSVVVCDHHRKDRLLAVMLYSGNGFNVSADLPIEEARNLQRKLAEAIADYDNGPREGIPADLGCEVL